MTPLQALLGRIRWDPAFGKGRFVLGYLDHRLPGLVEVDLADVDLDPDNHSLLQVWDDEGVLHRIPLHRVKEVRRDGELIWRREH
jgi:uncharacterized protein (UPF0248 family)